MSMPKKVIVSKVLIIQIKELMNLIEMISLTSLFAIGISVIGIVARNIFIHILNKDINSHKHNLEKITLEHQITFSKLHLDRAEIIRQIYVKTIEMERAMHELLAQHNINVVEESREKINELKNFFECNRIYFKEDLAMLLDQTITVTHNAYFDASWNREHSYVSITDGRIKEETVQKHLKGLNAVKNEFPELKRKLEGEFRKLIGVE